MTLHYSRRDAVTPSAGHTLPWAVFLACSWTWCIGMWLPVLLVRDYGIWGWIVFAVPNVVGAAAMGWALRDADDSRRLVAAHESACRCFSVVTLAFHVFWVVWLSRLFDGLWAAALVSAAAFYLAGSVRSRGDLCTAIVALVVSLCCFAFQVLRQRPHLAAERWEWAPGGQLIVPLLALALVCCFGFALCPYLDLTFHRARQATTPVGGRIAFGVGFGVFFLLMIAFTLVYSVDDWISRFLPRVSHEPTRGLSPLHVVAIHMAVQAGYTVAVHARALRDGWTRSSSGGRFALPLIAALAILLGLGGYFGGRVVGLRAGELVYRLFMSFYGLVFPAYAWLCMLPTWRSPQNPTRRQLAVFAAAVLLAAPFYYVAFIGQKMPWVAVGVAIVLLARLALAGGRGRPAWA